MTHNGKTITLLGKGYFTSTKKNTDSGSFSSTYKCYTNTIHDTLHICFTQVVYTVHNSLYNLQSIEAKSIYVYDTVKPAL